MRTQAELRADFLRFLDEDLLDEAEAALELLEPLSEEEWQEFLANVPEDDEPLTESEGQRLAEVRNFIAANQQQQAG
jgi:hypothetical protein